MSIDLPETRDLKQKAYADGKTGLWGEIEKDKATGINSTSDFVPLVLEAYFPVGWWSVFPDPGKFALGPTSFQRISWFLLLSLDHQQVGGIIDNENVYLLKFNIMS